jgi:hypothetical protein
MLEAGEAAGTDAVQGKASKRDLHGKSGKNDKNNKKTPELREL